MIGVDVTLGYLFAYLLIYRSRRIVTTASAKLISQCVDCGGVKTLIIKTIFATRNSTDAVLKARIAAITLPRRNIYRVLPGKTTR